MASAASDSGAYSRSRSRRLIRFDLVGEYHINVKDARSSPSGVNWTEQAHDFGYQ